MTYNTYNNKRLSTLQTEDHCPLLNSGEQEVHGAWFDNTLNGVGELVTYTCLDGMTFPDGDRQKTIECLPGGNWSEVLDDCQGQSTTDIP
mgnify:FL=1